MLDVSYMLVTLQCTPQNIKVIKLIQIIKLKIKILTRLMIKSVINITIKMVVNMILGTINIRWRPLLGTGCNEEEAASISISVLVNHYQSL